MEATGQAIRHETTVIEPSAGWRAVDLRELWAYRDLLWVLVSRDLKVRYKQTALGAAWVLLRPLLSMGLFTLVFGQLAGIPSDGIPYPVFVYAALVPWTFFANAVGSAAGALVGSAGLIGKVYFPRLVLPVAMAAGGLVDFAISAAFLLILMPLFGVSWGPSLLALPLLLLAVALLALAIGTLFSALTVAYRDFGGILQFGLQLWMFATPVVYPASLVPSRWRWVVDLNPMAPLVEGFRSAIAGRPFPVPALAASFAITAVVLFVAVAHFKRVERRFADII